jgi:hypothetical protein
MIFCLQAATGAGVDDVVDSNPAPNLIRNERRARLPANETARYTFRLLMSQFEMPPRGALKAVVQLDAPGAHAG